MFHHKLGLLAITLMLASCSMGKESTKVQALQKKDKNLSCKEILLEMNEAEFYRDTAHRNRGPKLTNILMPLGYISTYMDAGEAIEAAEARVSYLDKIYNILRCEEKEERMLEMQNDTPYYKAPREYNMMNEAYNPAYYREPSSYGPRQQTNTPIQYPDNSGEYSYSGIKYYK